jgi:mono/diheme cytochrome c family protein
MKRRISAIPGIALAAMCLYWLPAISANGDKTAAKQVSFNKDVAPILFKNCAQCHRPDDIAPFSVLSYKDARPWAKSIREKVISREMPPWGADPHFGEFSNDTRLSQSDIDTVVAWVDGGAKEGAPKDLPPAPNFSDAWRIGKPDVVLSMPEEFALDARGADDYIYFRVPTNFTEDKWIQAAEFRPGNKRVVHHAVVFIETPQMIEAAKSMAKRGGKEFDPRNGASVFERAPGPEQLFYKEGTVWRTKMDTPVVNDPCNAASEGSGRVARSASAGAGSMLLTAYAPGKNPDVYQPGVAKKIPAGSNLILQMHYSKTTGKTEKDRTSIGFVFAKQPVEKAVETLTVVNSLFAIPPGAENHAATACYNVPREIQFVNYFPHMHVRGKDMKYEVVYPDGRRETLLWVEKYNFNWQTLYALKNPIPVPKGARFMVTAHFDNSAKNKFNPDPTKTVRFGEPTYDEMLVGYADVIRVIPKLDPKLIDAYVGEYEVGPGMNFTITREGDKLFIVAPGFGKNEMFPDSENKFTLNFAGAQLTFNKNEKGELNDLTFEVERRVIRAKRVSKPGAAETNK